MAELVKNNTADKGFPSIQFAMCASRFYEVTVTQLRGQKGVRHPPFYKALTTPLNPFICSNDYMSIKEKISCFETFNDLSFKEMGARLMKKS